MLDGLTEFEKLLEFHVLMTGLPMAVQSEESREVTVKHYMSQSSKITQ